MKNLVIICSLLLLNFNAWGTSSTTQIPQTLVSDLIKLPLGCVAKKLPHYEANADSKYPIFFGCYDWHSAVHSHWSLLKLYFHTTDEKIKKEILEQLNKSFTKEKALKELAYFNSHIYFETPYGVAWYLKLILELEESVAKLKQAQKWLDNLRPLTEKIESRAVSYVQNKTSPTIIGLHPNTAFALELFYQYSQKLNKDEFTKLIEKKAIKFYNKGKACNLAAQPSREDFISPCFAAANLMASILSNDEYKVWLEKALPDLLSEDILNVFEPASTHQMGLLFYKAYAFKRISTVLSEKHSYSLSLLESGEAHLEKAIDYLYDDDYMGTHWLVSFALLAI